MGCDDTSTHKQNHLYDEMLSLTNEYWEEVANQPKLDAHVQHKG